MKPMKLTAMEDFPKTSGWIYEAKYDGFRCLFVWEEKVPQLLSMSGKNLNEMFPEVLDFCNNLYDSIKRFLPITCDGELVYLENSLKSNFSIVQRRSRMRRKDIITKSSSSLACHYLAFDLLTYKGNSLVNEPLTKRKEQLVSLFDVVELPLSVNYLDARTIQAMDTFADFGCLWNNILKKDGEGVIAKRRISRWKSGTRSIDWLKKKNWRVVTVILTKYDPRNSYFHGAVYDRDSNLVEIVHFRHGLKENEEETLIRLFQKNATKRENGILQMEPSICVDIACIDFDGKHIREPRFSAFSFEQEPIDCTWTNLHRQLLPLPKNVEVTSLDKPVWPELALTKDDYLFYLQTIAPLLLPNLNRRLITVIRYPHGVIGEHFYQKNCPNYAPDFVDTKTVGEIDYIICNKIETLIWLGNQLALEFHIPFQTIETAFPTEVVFDLDPPSEQEFPLAIEAALSMKAVFDELKLHSFLKTSGRKGLQVYIPLPFDQFSYEETRRFTSFVCQFLCEQEPQKFTTERLKKNRGNRLYLDYIQHDEGKTIIAPYSPRGTKNGLVATPLYWDEVNHSLTPLQFSIPSVIKRVNEKGDPFRTFRHVDNENAFRKVLEQLR